MLCVGLENTKQMDEVRYKFRKTNMSECPMCSVAALLLGVLRRRNMYTVVSLVVLITMNYNLGVLIHLLLEPVCPNRMKANLLTSNLRLE